MVGGRNDIAFLKKLYYTSLTKYENYQFEKLCNIRKEMEKVQFEDRRNFLLNEVSDDNNQQKKKKSIVVWSVVMEKLKK